MYIHISAHRNETVDCPELLLAGIVEDWEDWIDYPEQ